jgi:hypothetical protein
MSKSQTPNPTILEYLTALGRLGGKAGKGKAKRRGDSAYYRKLRAKVRGYTKKDGTYVATHARKLRG